jgi:hypothetical protein
MSKEIVEKNMHGILSVSNQDTILEEQRYFGACFKVSIPKFSTIR